MKRAGFTLLEMLVGLALMALLAMMLGDGLRTGLEVTNRVDSRTKDTRALVIAHRAFHGLIESAFPLRSDDAHGAHLQFRGDETSLELVGPASSQQSGGLTTQGIRLEDGALVLTNGRGWRDRAASLSSDAKLSYFGVPERGQPAKWLSKWENRPNFPRLVRMRVPGWPDAIARPRLREAVR
jgi:prepilin-type N-terminal cleavage/methylation domain-containing protein